MPSTGRSQPTTDEQPLQNTITPTVSELAHHHQLIAEGITTQMPPEAVPQVYTEPCVRASAGCTRRARRNTGFCDYCYGLYARCACPCSNILPRSQMEVYPGTSRLVCQRFYYSSTVACPICHGVVVAQHLSACGRCGTVEMCESCLYSEHDHPSARIHDYSYRPQPHFLGNGTRLYMGVELEVDGGELSNWQLDKLWDWSDDERLFYLKEDGSLEDGFEVVTQPATLSYHRRQFPWRDVLQYLKDCGYRSHATTTCGLHVHVSKAGLGRSLSEIDQTIGKLVLLFWRHWTEIVQFSRRRSRSLETWAKPNHERGPAVPILQKLDDCKYTYDRYMAINTQPRDTIEFRLFRGTLERGGLLAALEFVQTAIDLCMQNGTSWIYHSSWQDVQRAGSKYLALMRYFARPSMQAE